MSEQADQTPEQRDQQDPWAPPADRTPEGTVDPGATQVGSDVDTLASSVDAGTPVVDGPVPTSAAGAEAETIGAAPAARPEAETIGAPLPGNHDGETLLGAPGEPGPAPEVSLTKGAAPQDAPPERDIWAPPAEQHRQGPAPAYGAPGAGPWQNPGGPAAQAPYPGAQPPYAASGPAPDGAVPPPPVGPEGPGPGYGYPGYGPQAGFPHYGAQPGYGWPHMPLPASNGMGTASLVLGIISAVLFCLWPVAIIVGVLAIIFGAIGRGKASRGEANNAGQALAGLICGCVGTALAVIFLILVVVNNYDPYGNDPYDFGDNLVVKASAPQYP
ncbi:DUF4190 domain-containing protein [Streptomyces sp. NPDC050418]|uniref:DUF4190 domain-containing protein n=1 Tax=Streptomyces sp. NPDC050418 TaxID=3365612 RepID=UPI0037A8766A